jgi:hypothetical protein
MRMAEFTSDQEVEVLVDAFESATISPSEFRHSGHIAVGLAYLASAPLGEATERMRSGLQSLSARHNATGYHETLTRFWMRLLDHLARARYSHLPLYARVNAVIESHGSMRPVFAHYTNDKVFSPEARAGWVDPDLLPLPF